MTDKDPKDMTVSEQLRWAANGEPYNGIDEKIWTYPTGKIRALAEAVTGEWPSDNEIFSIIADKIDAELAQARELSLLRGAELWAKANGWPDFRDGEDFGAWLDRCALPRPRFEDGEPVQMGDEIAICGGDIDVNEVVMLLDGSGYRLLHSTDVSASAIEDRVKRPAPEALGADGLPIVVGETVYPIDSEWLDTTLEVLSVESLSVKVSLPSGKGWTMFRAKDLTHTPPDTQERIDEDATLPPREYYNAHIGHDVGLKDDEEVAVAMVLDLLRRQRELDKRTGGE